MSNDLSIFESSQMSVPSHIADAFADEQNIDARQSVPTLSYEGKIWTVSLDGEKHRLTRVNEDGDEEPLSTMRVIVLDAAKSRGRTYYEGAYDPANIGAPSCWSDDGKVPHPSIAAPQCSNCAQCPMAAKGSKITEQGKATAACGQHRMLAVVPAARPDSTPLRLKIAITSDYDKQSPDETAKGWFAFSNFKDFLLTRGIKHTAQIVTKIKFDQTVAYPKLFFSPDRWLQAEEVAKIRPVLGTDEVTGLLSSSFTNDSTPASPAGDSSPAQTPAGDDGAAPGGTAYERAEAKAKAEAEAKAKEAAAAAAAEKKAKAEADAKAKAAAAKAEADAKSKAEAASAAAAEAPNEDVSTEIPDDVSQLLNDWGDD